MTKVLTLGFPNATIEVHMLNPGEVMRGFGGSRTGLQVGKTASLVLRKRSKLTGHQTDSERDITDDSFWLMIAAMLSGRSELPTRVLWGTGDLAPDVAIARRNAVSQGGAM